MNIIEQRIRMHIRKQLMLETEGVGVSGYDIKIPGTFLYGDNDDGLKRWRVDRINQQAKENGCSRGFLIIATNKNKSVKDKSTDKKKSNAKIDPNRKKSAVPMDRDVNVDLEKVEDSLLMRDITTTIQSIETYAKYYGTDYRIVLSSPIQRGKRKIFAAWIVDMNTTDPTRFRQLLTKIHDIQHNTKFKLSAKATQYFIGTNTEIITQSNAIAWTNSIVNYLEDLKRTKPNTFKDEFPKNEVSEEQLKSIPDFTKMNRIAIPVETYDANIKPGSLIDVDFDWLTTHGFNNSFIGTAIVNNDTLTGTLTLEPVEGEINLIRGEDATKLSTFKGTFKNGAPWKGTTTFNGTTQYDANENPEVVYENNDETQFIGEYKSSIYSIDRDSGPVINYQLVKLNGKQYYNKKNDTEAKYFDGTFTVTGPQDGPLWVRESKTEGYTKIGNFVNGRYISLKVPVKPVLVKYPYTIKNKSSLSGQTVYTSSNSTLINYVYIWVTNKNEWNQMLKSDFEEYVNKQITEIEFLKKITSVTDATVAAQLSVEFKKGTSYIELNTPNDVVLYNAAGTAVGDYEQIAADQKKLIWTGATIDRGGTKEWYAVHVKDFTTKELLPDVFWIKRENVAKEIPYGPK